METFISCRGKPDDFPVIVAHNIYVHTLADTEGKE
jgi:hypothetical protein